MDDNKLKQGSELKDEIEALKFIQRGFEDVLQPTTERELKIYIPGGRSTSEVSYTEITNALGKAEVLKLTRIFALIMHGTVGEVLLQKQLEYLNL